MRYKTTILNSTFKVELDSHRHAVNIADWLDEKCKPIGLECTNINYNLVVNRCVISGYFEPKNYLSAESMINDAIKEFVSKI